MSEAKACEVCKLPAFQGGEDYSGYKYCYYSWGLDCMMRGYERERAAREKAEAERDAAKAQAKEYRDNWISEEAKRIRTEADLAQARKELAEANKHLLAEEERRKLTGDALHAEGLLTKAEAARDEAIRLLREARRWFDGTALAHDVHRLCLDIDNLTRAHDSAATGDTPSNPGAGRQTSSVPPAAPATGRSSEELRGGVSTSDTPFAAIIDSKPEPAGRSEDEAERLLRAVVGYVVYPCERDVVVRAIRAALAAARHDGMMESIEAAIQAHVGNRCGPYSTCPVCGFADAAERRGLERAAAAADLWIRNRRDRDNMLSALRVMAAEPEKAS